MTFLITMVHRRAIDKVRATRAAAARDGYYSRQQPTLDDDPTAEAAHARLGDAEVRAALARLTSEQWQAIELAYFGGFTSSEVYAPAELSTRNCKPVEERRFAYAARSTDEEHASITTAQHRCQERQLGLPPHKFPAPTCRQSLGHALHHDKTSTLREPI
jgi:DNA-directed RNA polymerase specialized sigma24 family protein